MNVEFDTLNRDREAEELEELMSQRLGSRIRHLRLFFQQAGLVMQGWTDTWYSKQLAQHAAMELAGMPILANEIEVK